MRKIGEGAEAGIYLTRLCGLEAVAKVRSAKPYRAPALDVTIREQRTRREARIMALAEPRISNVPALLMLRKYALYMRRVRGTQLSAAMRRMRRRTLLRHMRTAGTYLARLHAASIVHGDYTPANLLVSQRGARLYLIDFGLSSISADAEEKATDLLLMKRAVIPECFDAFSQAYRASYNDAATILARLRSIERRGRYQLRTLQHASDRIR